MQGLDSAGEHWGALDQVFRRLVGGPSISHARTRFARRAATLSEIYTRRLAATAGGGSELTHQLLHLQQAHRALTAVLNAAWNADTSGHQAVIPQKPDKTR